MAVHGTRRGESVSWDYEGLTGLLSSLARERTGRPLLRCYWYEVTVDGRRTAQQDALADVPGIKLRMAKIRPGRREGVETEIHRDLTTLARNNAISDALVVSAEEDLAQVIADVQDLGMRVTLVHIAVDGNWTISRALRQESDDIMEIGGEQLRPYVELIAGAEPAHADEPADADRATGRTRRRDPACPATAPRRWRPALPGPDEACRPGTCRPAAGRREGGVRLARPEWAAAARAAGTPPPRVRCRWRAARGFPLPRAPADRTPRRTPWSGRWPASCPARGPRHPARPNGRARPPRSAPHRAGVARRRSP